MSRIQGGVKMEWEKNGVVLMDMCAESRELLRQRTVVFGGHPIYQYKEVDVFVWSSCERWDSFPSLMHYMPTLLITTAVASLG